MSLDREIASLLSLSKMDELSERRDLQEVSDVTAAEIQ
jgi:hypothetical protein